MIEIRNTTLANPIELHQSGLDYHLIYLTEEIESISRATLKKLASDLGCLGNLHLHTNAGIDLHSSEDELYGFRTHRLAPNFKEKLIEIIGK